MRKLRSWVGLAVSFLALVSVTQPAQAQIETKAETATALSGLESPTMVGNLILYKSGSPKPKPVGIVYVEAAGEISVEGSDDKRRPVEVAKVADGVYLVDRVGSTWVEISEYGEVELAGGAKRKILLDRKTVVVVVEPLEPLPPPGPGPDPSPPGPGPSPSPELFDGLAGKVKRLSANMDFGKKQQLTNVLDTIAQKMDRGEFLQIKQAAEYLNNNRPQCTPESGCAELYNFMFRDASMRTLSFEQAKSYYRELAKGLRQ